MLVEHYGPAPEQSATRRYSPAECTGISVKTGEDNPKHISTSYVERRNLNIRMGNRRVTGRYGKGAGGLGGGVEK